MLPLTLSINLIMSKSYPKLFVTSCRCRQIQGPHKDNIFTFSQSPDQVFCDVSCPLILSFVYE